jgi:hypothetical protein
MCCRGSVVDRHRFDANPDPDPTFYFDADPKSGSASKNANPHTDPIPSFTEVGKVGNHQWLCVKFLSILDSILKF